MYKTFFSLFALIILVSCSNQDEGNAYPESKKIDFIIDGSTSLLYGNPTYDLTDDVLFELRKYQVSGKEEKK